MNLSSIFRILDATRRQKEQITQWCTKAGVDPNEVLAWVEKNFKSDNEQVAAARWICKGYDPQTFQQALYICSQKKLDPMSQDPSKLVQSNPDIKPKEKPINPDDVLTDRKEDGEGNVTYAARDEDRQILRKIINTHYGPDANPWCLLQGDGEGNLTEASAGYWKDYSAYPKRVAFRNGKLLAFSAGQNPDVREWWDRFDRSFPFIPYEGKTWVGKSGDTFVIKGTDVLKTHKSKVSRLSEDFSEDIEGAESAATYDPRSHVVELDGRRYRCEFKDGKYVIDEPELKCTLNSSLRLNGPYYTYFEDGSLGEKSMYKNGLQNGPYESYYDNGKLEIRCNYKSGKYDGPYESYYDNGKIETRCNYKNGKLDGTVEKYDTNSNLCSKFTFKDGERNGPALVYNFRTGKMENRMYKDDEEVEQ